MAATFEPPMVVVLVAVVLLCGQIVQGIPPLQPTIIEDLENPPEGSFVTSNRTAILSHAAGHHGCTYVFVSYVHPARRPPPQMVDLPEIVADV
eukprot:552959-Amorphochlora_amoeboformis.AAC.1